MGLLDGYFDPEQFQASGGLLGRLRSLQGYDGQYGSVADPNSPNATANAQPPPWSQMLAPLGMPAPNLPGNGLGSPLSPAGLQNAGSRYPANTLSGQAPSGQLSAYPGNAYTDGNGQPVVSDASPDPIRPGSHYAQAAMGLCAAGPVGCAAGTALTLGQLLGGSALAGVGALILNNGGSRPPPGSRGINKTEWSGDHTEIKEAVGAEGHS